MPAKKMKRYNMVMPEELYEQLHAAAEARQTTVVDLLRRFIRLGLLVLQSEDIPDSMFVIREGDKERQVLLI